MAKAPIKQVKYGDRGDHPGDFLNRDRAKEYQDSLIDEQDRKDRISDEHGKLDKDVKESPSAQAFLAKMKQRAKEQERDRKRADELRDKDRANPPKGRPGTKSPLPPYHTPPSPDREKRDKTRDSKPIATPPIPPYRRPKKPGVAPPFIPPRKPTGTPPLKSPAQDKKPPVIPPKRPQGTPPFKGGEAGILRFVTRKPRR